MAALTEKTNDVTPLQEKLEVIAIDIGNLGIFVATLIVHILILRYLCEGLLHRKFDLFGGELNSDESIGDKCSYDGSNYNYYDSKLFENESMPFCDGEIGYLVSRYVEIYIVAISIIVVAVPEGLPLAVMISLAYSIQKMLLDQNFVKKL
jgi:Ca2+ transporting ATPase